MAAYRTYALLLYFPVVSAGIYAWAWHGAFNLGMCSNVHVHGHVACAWVACPPALLYILPGLLHVAASLAAAVLRSSSSLVVESKQEQGYS